MLARLVLLLAALAGSPALADDMTLLGVGVGHAVSAPFYFPGSPAAIYSTRKVVSAYSGEALNVRRASDSATQDIGFVGAAFDTAGANSFCASTFCYVTKWYDQSGNGNDASQAITGYQPMLLVLNGKAWVTFFSQLLASASPVALTGDQTIGAVMMTGDGGSTLFPLSDYDGSAGWAFIDNYTGAKQAAYWSNGGGFLGASGSNMVAHAPSRLVATRTSGSVNVYVNGTSAATATGASNTAPTVGLMLGGYNGNATFSGMFAEVFVYSSALSGASLASIDANEGATWGDLGFETPYSGASSVQFGVNQVVSLGNVLDYERTQPWTVFAAIQLYNNPNSVGQVIFSNVPASGPPYPGYELWIDTSGHLRVRLINNQPSNYLDVSGTTNVVDGKKHFVSASYDGSSTAAGVKMYVDGVPETTTILADVLSASIIGTGQGMILGAQQGPIFELSGTLGHFQIDNVARSAAYIAAHATPASLPPIDANTALSLALTDGSGTTAADASGNGHNGTLTSANMWVP